MLVLNNTPFVHARVYLQYLKSALPRVIAAQSLQDNECGSMMNSVDHTIQDIHIIEFPPSKSPVKM